MSLLSTIPRGIVIAIQIALVALVIFATVPIALGGVDVNVTRQAEVTYDDYDLGVIMEADVNTDLYFDITGFHYGVYLSAGDVTLFVNGNDIGTVRHTSVKVEANVPFALFVMMMLCGASRNADVTITVEIHGSTLGGMISGGAKVDTVIAEIGNGSVSVSGDMSVLTAEFTVAETDLINEMLPGNVTITIGDVVCTVGSTFAGGSHTVTVNMTCSAGSLADALSDAMDTDGPVRVVYDDGTGPKELTLEKADVGYMVSILKLLHGRHHA